MNDKLHAYVLSSVLLLAMLAPAFRDPADDSFPFSTFPMFSRARKRTEAVTSALAVSADGTETVVPAAYIANSEPMQAVATLQRTVSAGRKSAGVLCSGIAERLAHSDDPRLAGAKQVLITTRDVDAIAYLAGHTESSGGKVHARCDVRGATGSAR